MDLSLPTTATAGAHDGRAPDKRPADVATLAAATEDLETPYAVVDLTALRLNAADLTRRAGGKPIRVASKSVRSRPLLEAVLRLPGYAGVLAYTLPEALWLAEAVDDVVVGYPTADRTALRRLGSNPELAARVAVMVDSSEHLAFMADLVDPAGPPIRVCLDVDASLRLVKGRLHLGARRSPLHEPDEVVRLARQVVAHPRFELVGLMAYEAQIAGVGDDQPGSPAKRLGVRAMQRMSGAELRERRQAVVSAVRAVAPLAFVNGGGTGSVELTASEESVTEVAAGSGLFASRLFDHYTRFTPSPAAYFVLSVVRRPSDQHATVLGGGWIASGAAGTDRLPTPVWPEGLKLLSTEGAGEVQTPLAGPAAGRLRIGDRVWFRHAKAGELCEHVDALHLVDGGRVVETMPTYRGEGMAFL